MIEEGNDVVVYLSGGKDSYTMLEILRNLQQSAPINFSLVGLLTSIKSNRLPGTRSAEYLEKLGVEYRLLKRTLTVS